jgi:hypothetical protein
MLISSDKRLETEAERKIRVHVMLEILDEICEECRCTPLDVVEAMGFELTGSKIVN